MAANAPHVCIVATGARTWGELQLCLTTLEVWHPDAHVYIATDSNTYPALRFSGTLTFLRILDAYSGRGRAELERIPGTVYASAWTDFMYAKATVMQHVFETVPDAACTQGVWFLDADITLLAPLPTVPATARAALSPHAIRAADEARYGRYNGGFLWLRDPALLDVWRAAGHTSRFYEQAALEAVATAAGATLYEFPPSVNFGWWRMFQADVSPETVQGRFRLNRADTSVGIRYEDATLQSIHTHWYETAGVTGAFNEWFRKYVGKFRKHAPIGRLLRSIG